MHSEQAARNQAEQEQKACHIVRAEELKTACLVINIKPTELPEQMQRRSHRASSSTSGRQGCQSRCSPTPPPPSMAAAPPPAARTARTARATLALLNRARIGFVLRPKSRAVDFTPTSSSSSRS